MTALITITKAELTETPISVKIAGIAERAMTATTTAMSTRIQKEESNIIKRLVSSILIYCKRKLPGTTQGVNC